MQVGGKFFLSDEDLQQPLLCIAGGIGITPITSMITHYADKAGMPPIDSEITGLNVCRKCLVPVMASLQVSAYKQMLPM